MRPTFLNYGRRIGSRLAIGLLGFVTIANAQSADRTSSTAETTRQGPSSAGDLLLIRDHNFSDPGEFAHYHGAGNNDHVISNRHHNVIAEYNPLSLALKGAMLGYQKLVSEQLARHCPYEISCSNFCKESINEYGIFKGLFMGADRILRCNRIGVLDVSPLNINPYTGAIIDPPNIYR